MVYHRIRNLREDKDLRQQDLADYLGITQRTYSRYECGERTIPPEILCGIADFHHVSVDYLLNRVEDKSFHSK